MQGKHFSRRAWQGCDARKGHLAQTSPLPLFSQPPDSTREILCYQGHVRHVDVRARVRYGVFSVPRRKTSHDAIRPLFTSLCGLEIMEHTSSPAYTATLIDSGRWLAQQIVSTLRRASDGAVLARYIRASYQDDPVRSAFELLLFLLLLRYLLASKYSPKKVGSHVVLSEKEIDEMVEDWEPEPLVQEQSEPLLQLDRNRPSLHRDAPCGPRTKLCDGKTVTNLANYNHYNLSTDPALVQSAVDTIRTYGVGPCSAPGFIGTFDVHLKLEQDIASHFGTEGAVIYSQSFSTISSVISAFCKRGDIIVADRAVNFPIRKGIQASRGIVRWFQHNDMEDLERVLASLVAEDRPLTRRFIITEGLSENVGDIVDLPRLLELKTKYKFRVVLDET